MKIEPLHCQRCKKNFFPMLDSKTGIMHKQKSCPFCNSPYWDKPVERHTVSKSRKK